ncbi:hypothetical protein NFI96_002871 [Prochilodus magdalenae]|nr:hypothetical protein NFI96_002871 [Prochilodus magdalenae]
MFSPVSGGRYVRELAHASCVALLSWFVTLLSVLIVAMLVTLTGRSMFWYSHFYTSVCLYGSAAVGKMLLVHTLAKNLYYGLCVTRASESVKLEPEWCCESVKVEPELSCESVKVEPEWSCESVKVEPEWSCESVNVEPELSCESVKVEPEWSSESVIVKPEWSCESVKVEPEWSSESVIVKPEWSCESVKLEPELSCESVKVEPEWSCESVKVEPEWSCESVKVEPEWSCESVKVEPEWSYQSVKLEPKLSCESVKVEPKLSCESVKVEPEWSCEPVKVEPEWSCEPVKVEPEWSCEPVKVEPEWSRDSCVELSLTSGCGSVQAALNWVKAKLFRGQVVHKDHFLDNRVQREFSGRLPTSCFYLYTKYVLGGVEEPDASRDGGSPESVCGAAQRDYPASEPAPFVLDDGVQWVPIIIHTGQQFVQCPPLSPAPHLRLTMR